MASESGRARTASAQFILGAVYAIGDGVPKNDIEAYAWSLLAKAWGAERAGEIIKILEKWLTAEQRAEGQARAAELDRTIPRE